LRERRNSHSFILTLLPDLVVANWQNCENMKSNRHTVLESVLQAKSLIVSWYAVFEIFLLLYVRRNVLRFDEKFVTKN